MRRRVVSFLLVGLVGCVVGVEPTAGAEPCPPEGWSREALLRLPAAGFEVPEAAARDRLALDLVACLEFPDPELRDQVAFTALAHWLRARALAPETTVELARRLTARLEAPADAAGFAWPFAALALSEVARADRLDATLPEPMLRSIAVSAAGFLAGVRDYRGFDAEEGWRHGVAHGADLVLQLGLNPRLGTEEVRPLLEAVAAQVAPGGEIAYIDGEPDRLARAVFFIHQRGLLPESFWQEWLEARGKAAPFADWSETFSSRAGLAKRHNTAAFLHALGFAARVNPSPASTALAALVDRQLARLAGGA